MTFSKESSRPCSLEHRRVRSSHVNGLQALAGMRLLDECRARFGLPSGDGDPA